MKGREMKARDGAKADFLARAGWGDADLAVLAGDASNRRYDRLTGGSDGASAVLMDAPAARGEDIGLFLAFTGALRDRGFSAPEILAADIPGGWALIEDLGDDLFARVCAAQPEKESTLYAAATDLLADLHRAPPPVRVAGGGASADVAPYDAAVLTREAMLALDYWLPGVTGAPATDDMRAEFTALLGAATAHAAEDRRVLVLRDYHAENLVWLPERDGLRRVGLLDYQDALAGSPAYDLVSLLEDARRDTDPALRAAMIDRYVGAAGLRGAALATFRTDYSALGAQRNLKIIGIFARLCLRDGKPQYLALIPRVWAHLGRDLTHPALAPLARFVAAWLPAPTPENLARLCGARS